MAGRGVLVVGGASAIAGAVALRFAADGDVVVSADLVAADEVPAGEGAGGIVVVADCATAEGATAAVDAVLRSSGRLDVVVLAAAAMPVASLERTTAAQWAGALDAVLGTAYQVLHAALPRLGRGAAVVAVSSVNATLAAPGLPAYAAAKGGLEALVRQLALEYGPRGVRVNAVAPGLIGGGGLPEAAAGAAAAGAAEEAAGYPLGRTGTAEDVAAAVVFLASAEAAFVTGVTLPVDGGLGIASPAAFLRPDLRARFLEGSA